MGGYCIYIEFKKKGTNNTSFDLSLGTDYRFHFFLTLILQGEHLGAGGWDIEAGGSDIGAGGRDKEGGDNI